MKALIAMSGGVDSSVAALLTQKQGYECIGATMKLLDNAITSSCCTEDDINDALKVCNKLQIPHYIFNFSDNFKKYVVEAFVSAYENGYTPNPCIECNRYLKFNRLFEEGERLGCDKIITGHYARIAYDEKTGRYLLKKAFDTTKDQTYVLYSLTQKQLSKAYFPLGELNKDVVRKIASENNFINASKKDSQDICFIKDIRYTEFIEKYREKVYPVGNFIDANGKILGNHNGIIKYTVGQRKKLGLSLSKPMYVTEVRPNDNTIVLGNEEELFKKELTAHKINLISVPEIKGELHIKAKIRYRQAEADATVIQSNEDEIRLIFDEPQRAITKGQSVVLYDGDIVVGGGIIK